MKKYKLIGTDGMVMDMETGMAIPNSLSNRHYKKYQEWLDDGNTPDPEFTQEELDNRAWSNLRKERNIRLNATDFMMIIDLIDKMTVEEQEEVKTYRELLRDLPANTEDPHNPSWPEKPQIVIKYTH